MNLAKPYYLRSGKKYPVKGTKKLKDKTTKEQATPYLIHGKVPDSSYEANVAQALDYFKFTYEYQVPIEGGRDIRGGQILDFVVSTSTQPSILDVRAKRWHQDRTAQEMRVQQIIRHYRGKVLVIVFEDTDCDTFDHAVQAVRRKLL